MATATKPAFSFAAQPAVAKIALGIVLVVAMCLLYYFVLQSPLDTDIETAASQQEQLATQMASAQQQQREYIRLRQELTRRQGLNQANMRVLPESAEVPSLVQDLNRLAELSGVQIRQLEPRPEEAQPNYIRLPVGLRFRGRYHQLARFLNNVSHLERAISMENLSLTSPSVVGDEVLLEISTTAITFRRPDTQAQAPVAHP